MQILKNWDIQKISKKWGRFARAQSTILSWSGIDGAKSFGFYIPYRYASDVPSRDECFYVDWLKKSMDRHWLDYEFIIDLVFSYNERFLEFAVANPNDVNQPRFNQDWFTGLDGAVAYTMVRLFKPSKIIEVGSGHSTRFMAQAILDELLNTQLISIDPQPRRFIDKLCSQIIRSSVTECALEKLSDLAKNDILFVDCSHIAMPGTDVDYLFTQVLPLLKKGVIIHIHDIFLPHSYPQEWQWRGYNEQNFLLAVLSGGERYEVICPNAYVRKFHQEKLKNLNFTLPPSAKEASFWMRVK